MKSDLEVEDEEEVLKENEEIGLENEGRLSD